MNHVLDNPAWNALNTGNSNLAHGNDRVKFFDSRVSPFAGLQHNTDDEFRMLHELLPHDGPVGFVSVTERNIPAGWQVLQHVRCYQMIHNGLLKPFIDGPELTHLTTDNVPQMLQLTQLTNPGPFAQRTIEFGHYYGVFDGDKLVAMAGQRLHINNYTEISAVCTHPDYLGRGYARQLLLFHINRMLAAGNVPILHVRTDNHRAIKVYENVGLKIRGNMNFYIMKKA